MRTGRIWSGKKDLVICRLKTIKWWWVGFTGTLKLSHLDLYCFDSRVLKYATSTNIFCSTLSTSINTLICSIRWHNMYYNSFILWGDIINEFTLLIHNKIQIGLKMTKKFLMYPAFSFGHIDIINSFSYTGRYVSVQIRFELDRPQWTEWGLRWI